MLLAALVSLVFSEPAFAKKKADLWELVVLPRLECRKTDHPESHYRKLFSDAGEIKEETDSCGWVMQVTDTSRRTRLADGTFESPTYVLTRDAATCECLANGAAKVEQDVLAGRAAAEEKQLQEHRREKRRGAQKRRTREAIDAFADSLRPPQKERFRCKSKQGFGTVDTECETE